MLFRSFDDKLIMSLHCPNIHEKKRILLFEMEEEGDKLAIVNELTGNWYNNAGGSAKNGATMFLARNCLIYKVRFFSFSKKAFFSCLYSSSVQTFLHKGSKDFVTSKHSLILAQGYSAHSAQVFIPLSSQHFTT